MCVVRGAGHSDSEVTVTLTFDLWLLKSNQFTLGSVIGAIFIPFLVLTALCSIVDKL